MDLDKTISLKEALDFICARSEVALDSCNSHHITCVTQQIRGVVWLFAGKEVPTPRDLQHVLDILKVPYKIVDGMIYWGDDLKQFEENNDASH